MKTGWRAIFRVEFRAFYIFSLDTYVCVVAYIQYIDKIQTEIRIPCRRPTLVAKAVRQPVARGPRLSQFSPQSLHPSELPRVSFRGEASQLCPLWPPARTPLFPVRSRGIGSPSSALVGQRACSAGTAVSSCVAKSPSFEAGAGPGFEKNGGLKVPRTAKPQISFADWELLQQGISLGSAAAEHLRLSGRFRG